MTKIRDRVLLFIKDIEREMPEAEPEQRWKIALEDILDAIQDHGGFVLVNGELVTSDDEIEISAEIPV